MSLSKERRDALQAKIIEQIGEGTFATGQFAKTEGLSIQTVYRYLRAMEERGVIATVKTGRENTFGLNEDFKSYVFKLEGLYEDLVWKKNIEPFFSELPNIAKKNLSIATTEILNNAIDHSGGTEVKIILVRSHYKATVYIVDDGVGIFNRIAGAMGLQEESYAILELSKGKLSTDSDNHSGMGIFFSSKMVDEFCILSGGLMYNVKANQCPNLEVIDEKDIGTAVVLEIKHGHKETAKEVYDRFICGVEENCFSKTIVSVRYLDYGAQNPLIVSRSQAKRLTVRFDEFECIELDFSGVEEIGQGFADELFRVFQNQHLDTKLIPINCSEQVQKMITHVKAKK